jgi:hypothetical protein
MGGGMIAGMSRLRLHTTVLLLAGCVWSMRAMAQNESGGTDAGSCTLHDHVYTCSGAAFQPVLANAKTVGIDVHNSDGIARGQLTALLTAKLRKTIAADGTPADLIFLLIPIDPSGVTYSTGDEPLGTLRVYSVTPDGGRGHLLWAESYSGAPDLPWPVVAHGLILQFQSHFHIR